ncbi:MAG: NUDIX hydrolase [Bacteroidota bacterium]
MENLLKLLKNQLQQPLPGEAAHALMAPYRKASSLVSAEGKNPRLSAVMMLLYPKNEELFVVLIKRNEYEGTHSAQVSFPGGRKDENDTSLMHTAIRETREEIGVEINESEVLGELSPLYIPPSNFLVTPFIAFKNTIPGFYPDPREVANLLEFPLRLLREESLVKETSVKTGTGLQMKVPYFEINNEIVWGATAAVLSEVKMLMKNSPEF